jgi:hypothetical protein
MQCPNCDAENVDAAKFCKGCGGALPFGSSGQTLHFSSAAIGVGGLALGCLAGGAASWSFAQPLVLSANTAPCNSAMAPLDIDFTGIARGTFVDLRSDGLGGNNGFVAVFVLDDGVCYQAVSNQSTEFLVDGESLWNEQKSSSSPDMATSRDGLFAAVEKTKGRRVFLKLVAPDGLDSKQAWLDLVATELPRGVEPWMPAAKPVKK